MTVAMRPTIIVIPYIIAFNLAVALFLLMNPAMRPLMMKVQTQIMNIRPLASSSAPREGNSLSENTSGEKI